MKKSIKNKVVVGMSGGVDSSVAAALLKRAGFEAVGVMMKFWFDRRSLGEGDKKDATNRCCSIESEKLARLVAKKIGIPFYVINVEKEFKKLVVDYFIKEYKAGNTPNPCVVCNKEIKFGFLINKASALGADYVATGHYARLKREIRNSKLEIRKLLKSKDKEKDQSYFLWKLSQEQLGRILFPVGEYTKQKVRKLAKKFKLPTAETPESQEVCFVSGAVNDFLKKYLKTKKGRIVDKTGKVLGQHQGLWFYTIGQRKGLEIPQGPWFVVRKDFKKNILVISKNQKDLLQKEARLTQVNLINSQKLPFRAQAKIRYKSKLSNALVQADKQGSVRVIFDKPQKAITPGQSAVFYKGKKLVGGGVIE